MWSLTCYQHVSYHRNLFINECTNKNLAKILQFQSHTVSQSSIYLRYIRTYLFKEIRADYLFLGILRYSPIFYGYYKNHSDQKKVIYFTLMNTILIKH